MTIPSKYSTYVSKQINLVRQVFRHAPGCVRLPSVLQNVDDLDCVM